MANTGFKGYSNLEEFNMSTGLATGVTKPNVSNDPHYVEPEYDTGYCPIPTLSVSPASYQADDNGDIFYLQIATTAAWTLTDDANWFYAATTSGTGNTSVRIDVQSLPQQLNQRGGTITVNISGASDSCFVNQGLQI